VSEVTEETNEEVVEDVKEVVSEEAVVEETKPTFDPKSWLEENEDSLLSYLQAKRTDYSSMDNATVVKNKLTADHPEWDDQEIAQELADKFGVGLKKIEIDREQMTDEEIKEAESINKSIERGQRLLKTEAHK